MSLITTQGLSKSYGADDIFSGLNLTIPPGARIALVGENGIGKTTLLNLLANLESPTEGKIQRANQLKIGYLPQKSSLVSDKTLWDEILSALEDLIQLEKELKALEKQMGQPGGATEELLSRYGSLQVDFENRGGYTYESRMGQVLSGLGFKVEDFHMPVNHLSGGQRTRALLGKLLLSSSNLLIFDEPTNHLDIEAIQWLEGYLKNFSGAVLLVSHDRYFIDQVCNQIWEMSRSGFETYRGNYSAYLEQRQGRWERQQEIFEAEKARLENELDFVKRNIEGQRVNMARGKLRRLSRRIQAIEQMGIQAIQGKSWSRISQEVHTTTSMMSPQEAHRRIAALKNPSKKPQLVNLKFQTRKRGGDLVIRTSNLVIGYQDGEKALFSVPDITLLRGECAALIGPNGAGKTTFLKTILEELPPLSGEVKLGANLDVGYFAQAHQDLNEVNTVLEEILSVGNFQSENAARSYLGAFLFSGDEVIKKISVLSGGERGRLALAKLSLSNANLLLLDEPTNHLDIPSQETLQSVLSSYPGTILLVSHDRYLISALASQIWEIDVSGESLLVYKGNYQAFLGNQDQEEEPQDLEPDLKIEEGDNYQEIKSAKNKALAADRKRMARLGEVEDRISELEAALEKLGKKLASPPDIPDQVAALGHEYREAETELEILINEWESLQNEIGGRTE
ncbi:MAG TPA: ABC transporter ATP-binding protein [Chloroflexi bacterium]|nr:ABC transporter ATP-binding protein [Chloroflexota bacterium]